MCVLAGNARLPLTNKIVDTYLELIKVKRFEVEATVTSIDPLTKTQLDSLAVVMKTQVGEGAKVTVNTKVDASILGGL